MATDIFPTDSDSFSDAYVLPDMNNSSIALRSVPKLSEKKKKISVKQE